MFLWLLRQKLDYQLDIADSFVFLVENQELKHSAHEVINELLCYNTKILFYVFKFIIEQR